ncbi:hypothetical protein TNCV_2374481 [Trichonephila clavipes]|nr:hypothetical protein TNCV_2374481 [Trichonephila clavipes]
MSYGSPRRAPTLGANCLGWLIIAMPAMVTLLLNTTYMATLTFSRTFVICGRAFQNFLILVVGHLVGSMAALLLITPARRRRHCCDRYLAEDAYAPPARRSLLSPQRHETLSRFWFFKSSCYNLLYRLGKDQQ